MTDKTPRKPAPYLITEKSGGHHADLDAAHVAARASIAGDLANIIRQMIEDGHLQIVDNKIVPVETHE